MMVIFLIAIAFILAPLILRQPYLGIVFTVAGLPVVNVLPSTLFFSSIFPLIGGLTLVGFLLQRKKEAGRLLFRFGNLQVLGLLFIGWMFISNPQAAWFGLGRNWVFTFIQLWVLIWLTGELLDTPKKHHVLMWVYSISAVVSASIAIQNGVIGADIYTSRRDQGYVDDPNIAAQYFIVGTLFLNYLRTVVHKNLPRLLAIVGMVVTFLGVFFTLSRTGILLIFVTIGLLILVNPSLKYRFQLIIMFLIGLLGIWFLSDNILSFVKNIVPAITHGTDTAGLRYTLWKVGWLMWLDNPLQGVGIGMFPVQLAKYGQGLLEFQYIALATVAHNMYIQILAETGFIGFTLFVLLLFRSIQNIWRAGHTGDPSIIFLRNTWFVVFLVMLLGGITLSSQYDKMVWFVIGVSTYFHNQIQGETQKNAMYTTTRSIKNIVHN